MLLAILGTFLRLGCTSFGGPVAHLGYFRNEFVNRRKWLTEAQFADCVAISQLLPGPGSSQTGMLIGLLRGGWPGAIAAWIGFTLPSAIVMTFFALRMPAGVHGGWLHALLLVAAAVVASAILTMRAALVTDWPRAALAIAVFAAMLLFRTPWLAPVAIVVCAAIGTLALHESIRDTASVLRVRMSRRAGLAAFGVLLLLLFGLPLIATLTHGRAIELAARLFATGSLVFGGGHVVLPILQSQIVDAGIAPASRVIAGYAAAQAVPGPLFTLSSYVGAIAYDGALGIAGAAIGTIAIFLPSFLLLASVLPFYTQLAVNRRFRAALAGANAGVVGLLAAAFVTPILTSAVHSFRDVAFAASAFVALHLLKWPAWAIVVAAAVIGALALGGQ
ncbi:MAG: chromate efflux transporter [Vulcanimicrobiaceae bacterium]